MNVTELAAQIKEDSEATKKIALENKAYLDTINARVDEIEAKGNRPMAGVPAATGAQAEHKKAFNAFLRTGRDSALDSFQASMSSGSDPDGGYAVPAELDRNILLLARNATPMRQVANVIPVSTPNYTKLVSIGSPASGWVGETSARPETTAPQFSALTPFWGEIYSNPGVTQQLLDDAGFNLESYLVEQIGLEFAAAENLAFTTGDGILKPKGILSYPTAATADATRAFGTIEHIVSGAAADFITPTATASPADCLLKIVHHLKPEYLPNATWMMNRLTLEKIRGFKDAVNGEYIYQPMSADKPATLWGFPVIENPDFPGVGANALAVAFGDFKRAFTVTDRVGLRMLRDSFTNKPYVMFYTTKRTGSMLTDSNAIKLLKVTS